MSYDLGKLEYIVLSKCYHCHGTGTEPNQGAGGDPPNGSQTCHICNGEHGNKLVTAEIWSVD